MEFSDEDHEYFTRLRNELARGPKGMCDALEYAPLDPVERIIEETRQRLKDRIARIQSGEEWEKKDGVTRKVYGTVHGSDIRRVDD